MKNFYNVKFKIEEINGICMRMLGMILECLIKEVRYLNEFLWKSDRSISWSLAIVKDFYNVKFNIVENNDIHQRSCLNEFLWMRDCANSWCLAIEKDFCNVKFKIEGNNSIYNYEYVWEYLNMNTDIDCLMKDVTSRIKN